MTTATYTTHSRRVRNAQKQARRANEPTMMMVVMDGLDCMRSQTLKNCMRPNTLNPRGGEKRGNREKQWTDRSNSNAFFVLLLFALSLVLSVSRSLSHTPTQTHPKIKQALAPCFLPFHLPWSTTPHPLILFPRHKPEASSSSL